MNKFALLLAAVMTSFAAEAQTLEKMNWFNEPAVWEIDGKLS